jgi:gamma-glutamylcyclotransferase (GGCT)/AIG2-like uncharacterized protein YtfP
VTPSRTLVGLENLFLYGTLRPSAQGRLGRARRERLQKLSVSLGAASMAGRLYDLGFYPGAIESSLAGDEVHGEAVRMPDPAAIFDWLDVYEGIGAHGGSRFGFERVQRPVLLAAGDEIQAWVYLYRGAPPPDRLVASGRWGK